ncbi:glycosyltransferase [Streptomyces sp. HNM0663]|uniref:Glycosyltransferase n=1 Tax=Streptomyces chengmaiensis TaxID=3040919 RepID=A0ABT6HVA7_9ACTN|nr:glycosyltransferase [Streptomyces chengmaiensis]MDH2392653.1 glycosyltransferase [Streptomyces chengmaiensis]
MIVKNESGVIERCLSSVRDLITTWVISDTGSTDGTQELIRSALRGIPGELYEEPWIDFGHNRSLNIGHARGRADYLLLLDADLEIRQNGPLPPLTAAGYMLRHEGALEYRIKRLVRGDIAWRYEGVTHEYLTTDEQADQANLDALVVVDHADGGSRQDKFERDARLLSAELERDPDNTRTVFYLAQTMRDMGRAEEAIALYERRATMGGWPEEVYYSLLQTGILRADTGDWAGGMDALVRAWETRPHRLEACYELCSRLRAMGRYRTAHAFACAGLNRPVPDDLLFVSPWVYRWGLLMEFSISAYWVGDWRGSHQACNRLLAMPELPEAHRRQTLVNREYAAQRLSAVLGIPARVPPGRRRPKKPKKAMGRPR